MISLKQLQRLSKLRPLTAKEKAILCYWNRADGEFTLTNALTKMSDLLLSYCNVYNDKELESVILPMVSEDQRDEFFVWFNIVNLALDHDRNSDIFFQKCLSLLNERLLRCYKPEAIRITTKKYSLTLNRKVDIFQINDEIVRSLYMYYRLLVYTITIHVLLSNAFTPKNDFFCIRSLICLIDVRNNISTNDSTPEMINELMKVFQKENQKLIDDYLIYIKQKYRTEYLWHFLGDDENRLKTVKSVEDIINFYYPTKPIPKSKEDTIFSEIKKLNVNKI